MAHPDTVSKFVGADEGGGEVQAFREGAGVPWIAHSVEPGNARNRSGARASMDVVAGEE